MRAPIDLRLQKVRCNFAGEGANRELSQDVIVRDDLMRFSFTTRGAMLIRSQMPDCDELCEQGERNWGRGCNHGDVLMVGNALYKTTDFILPLDSCLRYCEMASFSLFPSSEQTSRPTSKPKARCSRRSIGRRNPGSKEQCSCRST
jgi:hypothetical protein